MKNQLTQKIASIAVLFIFTVQVQAQLKASLMKDKVMRPAFVQIEKRKTPCKIGTGVETYITGDAHGTFYSARLNISKGKSVFGIGPCLQKRSLAMNGVKVSYSRMISGYSKDRYDEDEAEEMTEMPEDLLELRLLTYVQYTHAGQLSYKASRVETIAHTESNLNFNDFRTSTIEAALCAELDINLDWIRIRNFAGFTLYYHFDYAQDMYRPKYSPALVFGTGFIIPRF